MAPEHAYRHPVMPGAPTLRATPRPAPEQKTESARQTSGFLDRQRPQLVREQYNTPMDAGRNRNIDRPQPRGLKRQTRSARKQRVAHAWLRLAKPSGRKVENGAEIDFCSCWPRPSRESEPPVGTMPPAVPTLASPPTRPSHPSNAVQ